jgi:lipoprotein-releasing system permease protein
MLVIEKQKDIHVLRSLGSSAGMIRTIFLSEGLLLGLLGTIIGVLIAISLCAIQQQWKWLKIRGGSFLIDYFPVKLSVSDILIVTSSALCIVILSAWIPAHKASQSSTDLK